jgi:hypothetical protein
MKNDTITTILGCIGAIIAAVAVYSQNGGNMADWKLWGVAALTAAFGYFTNKPAPVAK